MNGNVSQHRTMKDKVTSNNENMHSKGPVYYITPLLEPCSPRRTLIAHTIFCAAGGEIDVP